jgi:hypothetical protein
MKWKVMVIRHDGSQKFLKNGSSVDSLDAIFPSEQRAKEAADFLMIGLEGYKWCGPIAAAGRAAPGNWAKRKSDGGALRTGYPRARSGELTKLVEKISRLLDEKQKRLSAKSRKS